MLAAIPPQDLSVEDFLVLPGLHVLDTVFALPEDVDVLRFVSLCLATANDTIIRLALGVRPAPTQPGGAQASWAEGPVPPMN